MMVLQMVERGLFGAINHCEASYIHDLRSLLLADESEGLWRREPHKTRDGNFYPTHGLGPVARYMQVIPHALVCRVCVGGERRSGLVCGFALAWPSLVCLHARTTGWLACGRTPLPARTCVTRCDASPWVACPRRSTGRTSSAGLSRCRRRRPRCSSTATRSPSLRAASTWPPSSARPTREL
eukprot:SAG22_NODE_1157_length_5331_cov_1.886086_5_plen_182_part_00